MATSQHNPLSRPILRWMPSFTDMAFLMPLVFMFTRLDGVPGMLSDGDTGWHVRAGEWMLQNGRIPHQDIFSFTMPGQPWYAWEWLWDVSFAWLHMYGGMSAVVIGSMMVICLTFALLFRLTYRLCGHAMVAIGLIVLAAAASTIHWLARPHLFTMLFIVIFLGIIQRARENGTKWLFCLPVLTILWANIHGGFLAGILILGAYGVGDLVSAALAPVGGSRERDTRQAVLFLLMAAACSLASLVNPYGYQLHAHIWQYLRDPEMTRAIVEFKGTNFQDGASGYLEALLVIGLCAAIWYGRRQRFAEVFLLAGWGHLALLVARNIPLFSIIAAPLLAPAVVSWIEAARRAPIARWAQEFANGLADFGQEFTTLERVPRMHIVSVAGLAVVALGMTGPAPGRLLKAEYDPKSYPASALSVLNTSQRIFTNDEWGDYLIYRMWPSGGKVYVDGRSDFYGSKFDREYLELINGKYDWERTLARYNVDTVLLAPGSGLATTIKESQHWRVAFDDGIAIVFRRLNPAGALEQISTPIGVGHGIGLRAGIPADVMFGDHGK